MKRSFDLIVALLIVFAMLLCACQPTPEVEPIPNKGDNEAETKIDATPLPVKPDDTNQPDTSLQPGGVYQPVFPAHWAPNADQPYEGLMIDADVNVPKLDHFPVHKAARRVLSQDTLKKIAGYVFPDLILYHKGGSYAREEAEAAMASVAAGDFTEETRTEHLPYLSELVNSSKLKMDDFTAAKSIEDIDEELSGEMLFLCGDGHVGMMYMTGNIISFSKYNHTIPQSKIDVESEEGGFIGEKDGIVNAEITLDDALMRAEEFFALAGMEDYELFESSEARLFDSFSLTPVDFGWEMQFMHSFGYVPFNAYDHDDSETGMFRFEEEAYNKPIAYEIVNIFVGKEGVGYFEWKNPTESVGIANDNVQLMSFDEIGPIIERMLTSALKFRKDDASSYKLEEIALTVTPQYVRNSSEIYMMPTWVCRIRHYYYSPSIGGERFTEERRTRFYSTIGFNAIDGTRMTIMSVPKY